MKCKKQWIKDPKWQETRRSLQGMWSRKESYCLNQLSNYIGLLNDTPVRKLCVVINYFNGAGFKPSNKIVEFKSRVIAEYERRIDE